MIYFKKNNRGFSFIEVLIVLALISILAGLSFPFYSDVLTKNNLSTTVNVIVQTGRRAQMLARSGLQDDNWGIKFQPGSMTLFKGASFATKTVGYDELISLPSNLSMTSGFTEVVFTKLTGLPSTTGTSTFTIDASPLSATVTINGQGVFTYTY